MDFTAAIMAHAQWKYRLDDVIEGKTQVDTSTLSRDNVCPLGQWIHSAQAKQEIGAATHAQLLEGHALFHASAAEVATLAMNGQTTQARALMDMEGTFTRASTWVIRMLMHLHRGQTSDALATSLVTFTPPEPTPMPRFGRKEYTLLAVGAGVVLAGVCFTLGAVGLPWWVGLAVALVVGIFTPLVVLRALLNPLVEVYSMAARELNVAHVSDDPHRGIPQVCNHLRQVIAQLHFKEALGSSTVQAAAANVEAVARTLTQKTAAAAARSAEVASSTEDVNADVSTVASTVEELSATISTISTGVTSSAKLSTSVHKDMASSAQSVTSLEASAHSVNDVVNLIVSIAEQTHMLALNATIEAARAGEVGKGFAVVASEVKELADATEKATRGITDKVHEIQSVSQNMSTLMHDLDSSVGVLNEQQESMADAVREQTVGVNDIAHKVTSAAHRLDDVSSSMVQLAQAVTDVDEVAAISHMMANQLHGVAVDLQRSVVAT